MLTKIYALPLFTAFVLAVVFIGAYAVINALYSKSKWLKAISVIGFLVSLFGILYISVLSRGVGTFSLELRPFYSFVTAKELPEMYRTVFMNVLLYVPFGVFLSYTISRKHKAISVIITVISALIVSVCVEAMQYVYSLGRCEIDDIIFNTLGALWGALGICLFGYLTKELENMKNNLTENQNILCDLCSNVLFDKNVDLPKEIDVDELLKEANQQAVFTTAYTALKKLSFKSDLGEKLLLHSVIKTARVGHDHIEIGNILTENGIEYVLFKGVASAAYYKKPDIRAMGDVDILIYPSDIEQVNCLLLNIGYTTNDDIFKKDNHISYVRHINGVRSVCEVHFKVTTVPNAVADEFNNCFKTVFEDKREISAFGGKCFVPSHFHHGVILLLHTATHLTSEGIGLRHICDWAVFVNSFSNDNFVKTFEAPLKQMGLWRFAQLLTLCCQKYLGADKKDFAGNCADELLDAMITDIMTGGNFGFKDETRYGHIKYISNRDSDGISQKGAFAQLMLSINQKAETKCDFVKKHKWLLPVGWVVVVFDYFGLVLSKKRKLDNIDTINDAKHRQSIYNEFKLFKKENE